MKQLRILAVSLSAVALSASALAGNTYVWNWNEGDAGNPNNGGGTFKKVSASYNVNTQTLGWYMTFGAVPGSPSLQTDGFWMALSSGPNPKGHAGQLAIFYMDAKSNTPVLNVFAYNGVNGDNSYKDGSAASGTQAPDKIASSLVDNSFVQDLSVVVNADGTRTLGFTVKVDQINGHNPLYPGPNGPSEWEGAMFGEKIGVWAHSVAGLARSYSNGYLTNFTYQKTGWLDLENQNTTVVPEPATLAVLGAGALALVRKRRK